MGPRYVNIMVFTEDLWFLSGMTTVLLQKTWQVWTPIRNIILFLHMPVIKHIKHNKPYTY